MTGREFRKIRSDLGLSYNEMASVLGVHGTTIRTWEKLEEIRKMAEFATLHLLAVIATTPDKTE